MRRQFTEEEAKEVLCHRTLQCNEMRAWGGTCAGSRCSAWEWVAPRQTKAFKADVQQYRDETGHNYNQSHNDILRKKGDKYFELEGYCALIPENDRS